MLAFIFVAIIISIVVGAIILKKKETQSSNTQIDIQHMENLSLEEQKLVKKIAHSCGSRFITQKDIYNDIICQIGQDFLTMSGWDVWDPSIHMVSGQFERLGRALNKEITILSYDPQYQIAKIQGTTSIYLTSCKRCSCPDYRNRRLPCKHMYALALELGGDIKKRITNLEYGTLYGLTFALAGRFAGGRDGKGGIRARISDHGGQWSDSITRNCAALVTGASPSATKIEQAMQSDIEILSEQILDNLFIDIKSETGGMENAPTQETDIRICSEQE